MDVSVKRLRSHTNGGCEGEVTATLYKLQNDTDKQKNYINRKEKAASIGG
jgi:hypothetical protein